MKKLLSTLLVGLCFVSFGQKAQVGLLIQFEKQSEKQIQMDVLNAESKNGEYQYLTGFDVYLYLFNENLTDQSKIEVKNRIEQSFAVGYSSFLFESSGAYAADLPEIFIQPKENWNVDQAKEFQLKFGFYSTQPYLGLDNVWRFSFDKSFELSPSTLINGLTASGDFNFVSQNMLYTLNACTNDPYLGNQWGLANDGSASQYNGTIGADMEVVSAWTMNTGENYIKVAVLDSGTDTNHVDLVGNLLPGFDATGGGSKGYPNTTYSNDGHGTCTAGIIAARGDNSIGIAGVAYDCKVIPVKIFYYVNLGAGPVPFSSSTAGTDGIIWAIDTAKADILSNSWGLRDADITALGIDTTMGNAVISQKIASGRYGKGTSMLFSSGNEGDPFSIWPASHPKTISVGASTMCDELKTPTDCSPENWWGSNHGTDLDVTAPGVKVLATDMTGTLGYNGFSDNDYSEFNGTSAACPNAAGVMALILSEDSSLTEVQAREILSRTAEQVGGYQYDQAMDFGWWADEMGYGRVNALKALQYMNSTAEVEENFKLEIYYENGNPIFVNQAQNNFEIYDAKGALVNQFDSNEKLIPLNKFIQSKGIYLLRIVGQSHSSRFVIQ